MKKKSSGNGGLKKFFAAHVEKLSLGLAALLGLLLIFSGFRQRNGIEPGRSPDDLRQQVTTARSHMDSFKWTEHYQKDRDVDQELLNRASETLRQIDVAGYATSRAIKPVYHAPRVMRTDPEVFAALDVQARAGFGTQRKSGGRRPGLFQGPRNPENPDGEDDQSRPIPSQYLVGRGESSPAGQDGKVEGVYFVVVTALVPYRKQVQEYLARFQNADDFRPERDLPHYVNWSLERAEVDVRGKASRWIRIADRRAAQEQTRGGRGRGMPSDSAGEDVIAPDAYLSGLTSPIVSGLNCFDFDSVARHQRIKSARQFRADMEARERRSRRGGGWAGGGERGPGRGDGGGMMSPDVVGPPGGGRDGGREGGREGGSMIGGPQDGTNSDTWLVQQVTSPEFDVQQIPEFKMFRYFDLTVRRDKVYQYRLRLELEDPNFPRNQSMDPPATALHGEVQSRLDKQTTRGGPGFRPLRSTTPSDTSNPVRVISGQRMLAGQVEAARQVAIVGRGVTYTPVGIEPRVKVIAVEFDSERAADLPLELILRPGSVAFGKGKLEPVVRWKGILEKEEDRLVRVNQVVLDVEGGRELGVADLTSPGEILVWDASREQLLVRRELSDAEDYPTFIFPKESEIGNEEMRSPDGQREGGRDGERSGGDGDRR